MHFLKTLLFSWSTLLVALPLLAEEIDWEALKGRPIATINIVATEVFDPLRPGEDLRIFSWANALHIRTRYGVIERELLFDEGEALAQAMASGEILCVSQDAPDASKRTGAGIGQRGTGRVVAFSERPDHLEPASTGRAAQGPLCECPPGVPGVRDRHFPFRRLLPLEAEPSALRLQVNLPILQQRVPEQ